MALVSVFDEIDRLFDELIRRKWGSAGRALAPADVHAVEDGWIVELQVGDLRAKDLKVEVRDRTLTVTGHRRRDLETSSAGGFKVTQHESSVQRTIALPAGADPDAVDAKLEGSTLTLHIRRRTR